MAVKKKLQIFISSTFTDLKVERQAAVEAILKVGHIPAGMELFAAGSDSQLETIRRWIDESDVYMLVLGGRYGSVDPVSKLSYTELEYDYAVSKNMPLFAVVATDAALDLKVSAMGRDVLENENPKELKAFRAKALSRVSSFFADPKDIKLAVHETLADFIGRYEFRGWISGADVPDLTGLLGELDQLRLEKNELAGKLTVAQGTIEKLQSAPKSGSANQEEMEIYAALKDMTFSTAAFNPDGDEKPKEVRLLKVFDVMRADLITGVTNQAGITKIYNFLYFQICSALEMYGLATLEKVAGVRYMRYRLSPKGKAFLVWYDKWKKAEAAKTSKSDGPAS